MKKNSVIGLIGRLFGSSQLAVKFVWNVPDGQTADLYFDTMVVAIAPVDGGFSLVCVNKETYEHLCKYLGGVELDTSDHPEWKRPVIFVSVEFNDPESIETTQILDLLKKAGYSVTQIGDLPWGCL